MNIETIIEPMLATLIPIYLGNNPFFVIKNTSAQVAISLGLSKLITLLFMQILNCSTVFNGLVNYIWRVNSIVVNQHQLSHDMLLEYYYNKYPNSVKKCSIENDMGKNKIVINQLNKKKLSEIFTFQNRKYKINIEFQNAKKNNIQINQTSDIREIIISSSCSIQILEQYIDNLLKKCNSKKFSTINVYQLTMKENKHCNELRWKCNAMKISKNKHNTIVSKNVQENFFDDLEKFMKSEHNYSKKGLPYKRGYVLHGIPGSGKTSLIKAIANEYQMPIFILDISIIQGNSKLIKIISEISQNISIEQKYLLVIEDIDRSNLFTDRRNRFYGTNYITDDCFLNILDGLDESYGRITIMTTNNINKIKKMPSLIRPGRIDKVVNIGVCEKDQMIKIINFYAEPLTLNRLASQESQEFALSKVLDDNIIITPAKLIGMIFKFKTKKLVVKKLNEFIDFTNLDIDTMKKKIIEHCLEKDDIMTYQERSLKKKMEQLENAKINVNRMMEKIDVDQEKHKLMIEKKQLQIRLLEITISEKRSNIEQRFKKQNIKISRNDIGIEKFVVDDSKH